MRILSYGFTTDNKLNMAGIHALPLTITEVLNSPFAFLQLLIQIGINDRCRTRLIQDEGISTAQELLDTRPKDLKGCLGNINNPLETSR